MAAAQKHVLRVYVARDTALKLTLLERPKSVEELKEIMQERFKPTLDGDFSLHYEDPDFDGDLCLLVDIQELPEKGTLRVIRPEEVAINTGRRSRNNPNNDHPHQNIKKARKAEVNYIINLPKDQTPATLETMREEIIHEVEKTERNHLVIGKLMNTTYALRRQEIVGALVAPRVRDVVDRWPALLMESQVFAEFHRINNVNLRNQFYKELDRHTPKLITLFRDKATKTGKIAEELARLMMIYDLQEQRNVNIRRALVLRALPVYLREDAFKFFRTCNSADCPDLTDTPVALLTVVTDDTIDAALFSPESICIVVEDEMLVSGPTTLADSFLLLFGYVYALDLQYPKNLELTFTFIQTVVMCLEDNKPLKGHLLMLKNDLFNE
ncbi:uncharacterized protein LOC127985893 [Carassius gibelio]|uniref:uncharacterized protein LOC127985893 n=1 Tax=Carassius gibelio TaxID=101364 RepID=UPI00227818F1|nr:uncharacterized protein LOC127985893 [Carassius gibelio]